MKKIITITLIFFSAVLLSAQEKYTNKGQYTLDIIRWENQWLSSDNISGIVKNTAIFNAYNSYSDASLSVQYESGNYKNIYDPQTDLTGLFNVISYTKLKNVFLYGRFGYNYSYMTGSQWRGLVNPYETPFMMTDSIPGNMSFELYSMEAGIGIPLGKHFSIGVDVKYDAGLMAKHKDLRNKNTYMNFDISPGVMFQSEKVNAGLNIGYIRNTERIEYKQEDQSSEKYLFNLYGMWLYNSSWFSSANTSRRKENNDYYGALQLQLIFGHFSLFDNFKVNYHYGIQTEVGYNNLIYGDVNQLTYSNTLIIKYGIRHRLTVDMSIYKMLGNKYLQRQELDPNSNIRVWVSYGGPVNCYIRDYKNMNIDYTYRHAMSATYLKWELAAGYRMTKINNKYKETPVNFLQEYNINEIYLQYTQYFRFGKNIIKASPRIAYFPDAGTKDVDTAVNTESGEIQYYYSSSKFIETENYQLMKPLLQEYAYWSASKISAGLSAEYSYLTDEKQNVRLYFRGDYNIISTLKKWNDATNGFRHNASLTVGFAF